MSVTEKHLDAMTRALERGEGADRKLLRECVYELSSSVSQRLNDQATRMLRGTAEPVSETSDLLLIDKLVGMGVQQNGLIPTMTAHEVGRALNILGHLLHRANAGQLEQVQLELLEAVFDHAAGHEEVTQQVRELEVRIRGGLGLDQRIMWPEQDLPLA